MFLTRASQSGRQMKVSEEVWVKTIQLWKSKEDIRNRKLASRDLKIYQHENDISPNLQQNDILSEYLMSKIQKFSFFFKVIQMHKL